MKRDRYHNVASGGCSGLVPLRPGEGHRWRHACRSPANLASQAAVKKWAGQNGHRLPVKNEGWAGCFCRPGCRLEFTTAKPCVQR